MTIQQCKYVLEIARVGSFSEAAKQLFIAQSGLSNSVKLLENELGIKIFERSKNGVSLSPEGAEFVRYAEELVAQSEFILGRYGTSETDAHLYISSQHYDFVADIFTRFVREAENEKFDLSLRELRTSEVISDIEGAYSDIGIIAIKESDIDVMTRHLNKKGIIFTQLFRATPHVYIRREHPLAEKSRISHEALLSYPYVSYEQGAQSGSLFTEEIVSAAGKEKRITISDRATLMNALISTDSYTIGTGVMPSALNDGKILCIPVDLDAAYHLGYITLEGRGRSKLSEKFISMLLEFSQDK